MPPVHQQAKTTPSFDAKTPPQRKSLPSSIGPSPQQIYQRAVGNQMLQLSPLPNKGSVIQRDEEAPSASEASVPSPDVNVENVEGESNTEVNSTLATSPLLTQSLLNLDPRLLNIYLSPISPSPSVGPLAPVNPTSQFFPSIPSSLQSSTPSSPSVPSELSLFGAGPFHFRIVFEEPKINVSEALRESEQRFSSFVTPPSEGIDTGKLIKGLITAFLTQTPPGQAILEGVTGAIGSDSDEGEAGPTVNINLDVLPSPVLKGQPPSLMFGVQGSF